jgi:hypothetical protein
VCIKKALINDNNESKPKEKKEETPKHHRKEEHRSKGSNHTPFLLCAYIFLSVPFVCRISIEKKSKQKEKAKTKEKK